MNGLNLLEHVRHTPPVIDHHHDAAINRAAGMDTGTTLAQLAAVLGVEEKEYRELMQLVVESGLRDLDEIRAALQRNDAAQAVRASHSLKGAALNVGLFTLAATAERIERVASRGNLAGVEPTIRELDQRLHAIASQCCPYAAPGSTALDNKPR